MDDSIFIASLEFKGSKNIQMLDEEPHQKFHHFIELSAHRKAEAQKFPEFEFMEKSIRINYGLIKKSSHSQVSAKEASKPCKRFIEYFKKLEREEQIKFYENELKLLEASLSVKADQREQKQFLKEGSLLIQTPGIMSKWEEKNVKLENLILYVKQKKAEKQYPLKFFTLRKSKNKEYYAWVLELLNDRQDESLKSLTCGSKNAKLYEEWYSLLENSIKEGKILYYQSVLEGREKSHQRRNEQQNVGDGKLSKLGAKLSKKSILGKVRLNKKSKPKKMKTLTELMVDNQMKKSNDEIDSSDIEEIQEEEEDKPEHQPESQQKPQSVEEEVPREENKYLDMNKKSKQAINLKAQKLSARKGQSQKQKKLHPNVFSKLFPDIKLQAIAQNNPSRMALLESGKGYQIYEVLEEEQINTSSSSRQSWSSPSSDKCKLRMVLTVPFSQSLVFKALSTENNMWNKQINKFLVKTKISSENSILFYQKHKSQGLFTKQRDFLFLRHCFSQPMETDHAQSTQPSRYKIFIADKSINSINMPPFMNITRGEKELIWCIHSSIDSVADRRSSQQKSPKANPQCVIIVEGWILANGYMYKQENKDMTLRYFKELLHLEDYLRQQEILGEANMGPRVNDPQVGQNQSTGQAKTGIQVSNCLFVEKWEVQDDPQQELNQLQEEESCEEEDIDEGAKPKIEQSEEFFDIPDAPNEDEQVKQHKAENSRAPTKKQQQKIYNEFIKKVSEQNFDNELQANEQRVDGSDKIIEGDQKQGSIVQPQKLTFDKVYPYTAPDFDPKDKTIKIPQQFLKVRHQLSPLAKEKEAGKADLFPHYRGHHLWKGEWAICPTGGLNYVDEEKMNEQRKVLSFIIRSIGRNILSGKGILNISLPVDIFCRQSNIERLASSFGYAPSLLEKACTLKNSPAEQLKYVIGMANFSSLIYLTMEKPFNPILGETYQSWIDGCPVYFEQISHHPPIASYLMIGRGYRLSGTMEAKMDLSINSGTGLNQGIFTVEFDDGRKFYYTTAAGELSGLTYGQRKLLLVGKTYYWCMEEGLFLELQFNPSSKKKGFFGIGSSSNASNVSTDANSHDYIEGTLRRYKPSDLEEHLMPKKSDFRKKMALPKSAPTCDAIEDVYKVTGRWTKFINFDGQKKFEVDEDRYYRMTDQPYALASHSNYREDVVYRRLKDFVTSQEFKEVWEVKQRRDRKLRETEKKKKK